MASIKDLKKRIGTVKNTQQTTRAMKMVSAAKLRRAQEAIQNQRPYAKRVSELIQVLMGSMEFPEPHPLMAHEANSEQGAAGKRILLVVVTSDRGLCGGFNSSVIKATQRWIQANAKAAGEIKLAFVGRKGHDFFKHKKANISAYYPELGGKVAFAKAKKMADALLDQYLKNEVDEIKIIYNEFKNAVTQKVVVEDFLPLKCGSKEGTGGNAHSSTDSVTPAAQEGVARDYIVKPAAEEVLRDLLEKNFSIQSFRILLESQAGEHGARMSAMENATKNAGEMIRRLTLQFNKQRQAGITKELLEIISGSEVPKRINR